VKAAIALRNQAQCVIAYHLAEDANPHKNGEYALARLVAPHCKHFIDVGANVGDWTAFFLEHGESPSGLLFEPGGRAFEKLEERFGELIDIELVDAALGAQVGEAIFFEEPHCGETSSLVNVLTDPSAKRRTCRVTTLDEELYHRGWAHVDFLKIDAEGYDGLVLRGAHRLLEAKKINLIQFEYNAPWAQANSTLGSVIEYLKAFGYEIALLHSDGLYVFDYARYGEVFRYMNLVAFLPEKRDWLRGFLRNQPLLR
tara:strand:+ start:1041 stop:1808 length:768 start_codon:yes stop_codon:yes gene_type:complete